MKLGKEVSLGLRQIVLNGDPAPLLQRGTAPNFRPCLLWPNGWMDQDYYATQPRANCCWTTVVYESDRQCWLMCGTLRSQKQFARRVTERKISMHALDKLIRSCCILSVVKLTVTITRDGYRSKYDVTRLLRQSFNNVELVVASWTSSSFSIRGTIALTTDGGVTNDSSEMLQSPTTHEQGYDRYNMTPYFENVRRRLSTSDQQYRFFEIIV